MEVSMSNKGAHDVTPKETAYPRKGCQNIPQKGKFAQNCHH